MFEQRVFIKGAGDLASGIAARLHRSGFNIVMTDILVPTTVRRSVAFSPAVYLLETVVEDIKAVFCRSVEEILEAHKNRFIAVIVDSDGDIEREFKPDILIDAIMAKRNIGTSIDEARIVIGIGPGFSAGVDCHAVIETKRGHNLGRVIWKGEAIPNTGIPGEVGGQDINRIIRAAADGEFIGKVKIGDTVKKGSVVGISGGVEIYALTDGVVRGLLQDGVYVKAGMKSGDIDPRDVSNNCYTISDKASSIGGGVLEAILAML